MAKKPTRPPLSGALASRVPAKGEKAAAPPAEEGPGPFIPRASKQKGRGVLIRTNLAGWQALRLLAYEEGRTLQDIGVEALQDVLRKYGRPPVVEHPDEG